MNILELKRKAKGWVFPCAPDAPDMTAQNTAASSQAATAASQVAMSAEQLAWSKQIYEETKPERAAATARAMEISGVQLDAMKKQNLLTDEYASHLRTTFQPLEKQIVAEAAQYDTPARREAESADAMAKVGTQFDVARGTMAREAAARGVDPSSGNFAAGMGVMGATQAGQQAGAGNAAAKQVEVIGAAKKMDAASLGRNMAANQATSAGVALNAGNSSSVNAQVPSATTNQGAALMSGGYNAAQGGLAGASGSYGSVSRMAAPAAPDNPGMWQAAGSVAGAALMAFSDEKMKEDIQPLDAEAALQQVEETPVSTYNYKPGTPGAADAGTGKTAGPMAQDVEKTMGHKVAPKGKKIDLIAMNGITMAAIQGLSKKVDSIAAAAGVQA